MSALLLATTATGFAQIAGDKLPAAEEGIGVDSKLGTVIDGTIRFEDTSHNVVELGALFDGRQPTILSFNYSNCPKLCSVQLDMLTQTLREISFSAGKEKGLSPLFGIAAAVVKPRDSASSKNARD